MGSGLSATRLRRMHDAMVSYVERGTVPGLVTLVSRRGEVHRDAIGMQAVGGSTPMAHDTIFRISSMTKPITAAATMLLVEECKLRLDDPVDRLLPELANLRVLQRPDSPMTETVPAQRSITLRDLLTFCLGTGMILAQPGTYPIQLATDEQMLGLGPPNPAIPPAPDEWMRRFGTLPLVYQPGEQWMYNTGAEVLSVLIARAANQPFPDFLQERLFAPLGMKDSGFSVPAANTGRFATSYWTDAQTGTLALFDAPEQGQWNQPPAFPSGAAGLVATVDDYLAFGQMLLNKGKHDNQRILARPSVQMMTTDQLTAAQKQASTFMPGFFDSHGWGFGMSVITRQRDITETVGKFGWSGGLGTMWYSDPQEEMVTILMTQCAFTSPDAPDLCNDFLTLAYQAIDD